MTDPSSVPPPPGPPPEAAPSSPTTPAPPAAPASPPPGWYPDPGGTSRWWDGAQWGQAAPQPQAGVPAAVPYAGMATTTSDDQGMATLVHVLGIFTGFLGPLVVYLIAKPQQPFLKHHAAEELNFQITVTIAYVVSFVLMLVLIGFVTFLVTWVASIVLMIMAAVAANRGEWYRYPVNLRLVPGAVGG